MGFGGFLSVETMRDAPFHSLNSSVCFAGRLSGGGVHVWTVDLDVFASKLQELRAVLSSDELDRSQSFATGSLRQRFTVTRGLLRVLIGTYLGKSPRDLRFRYNSYGKPSVDGANGLEFNLSHAGNLAAYGFVRDCTVGIDIEQIRTLEDAEALAQIVLSPNELSDLQRVGPLQYLPTFFRCWTRKEAYMKAIGEGFSAKLHSFRIPVSSRNRISRITLEENHSAHADWWVHDFVPRPQYAGAIVVSDCRNLRFAPSQSIVDILESRIVSVA